MADVRQYRAIERPFVATMAGTSGDFTIRGVYRLAEVWKVDQDQTLVGWLTRTVKAWDLTMDDEPLALTKEAMERALGDEDLALLRAVETAIREDATYPNLKTVKAA